MSTFWKIFGVVTTLAIVVAAIYYASMVENGYLYVGLYAFLHQAYDRIFDYYNKWKIRRGKVSFDFRAVRKIIHDPEFNVLEVLEDALTEYLKHGDMGKIRNNAVIRRYCSLGKKDE